MGTGRRPGFIILRETMKILSYIRKEIDWAMHIMQYQPTAEDVTALHRLIGITPVASRIRRKGAPRIWGNGEARQDN